MTDFKGRGDHTEHWGTPDEIFIPLNRMFRFTLDTCALDQSVAKVNNFISPEEDGLNSKWFGINVWCNPPYGRGSLKAWTSKAKRELEAGHCEKVVMLIPASISSIWFHENVIPVMEEMILVKRRIKFVGYKKDEPTKAANFDSVIVVLSKPKGFFHHVIVSVLEKQVV